MLDGQSPEFAGGDWENHVFGMLKSEHPEGEKNVLQMDFKSYEAYSPGQVN